VATSDLFEHLFLLPDHILGRLYESLAVPLVSLQVNKFIPLLFNLALLFFLHIY
jgi:hypothetical protein